MTAMFERIRLRPGTRYQTRDAFFARANEFRILEDFEWVKPLRLDLEPGSVGVFEREDGQKIIVRHEDDPRDRDEEQEEGHTVDEKLPEFMFTVVTPVGTFKRVSRQALKFAVVYVPEERRRAGQDGFCHGWTVTEERAQRLADEVRANFGVEASITAVTVKRRWIERTPKTITE
ncbi:hypothetical protein [Anaeromyxobacter sp. PSR-1]|uniref:hypothetical protein n=1 Tax=Anaeromyxobacter sp. PSR-1 TaxID=1300915 RepID=UPI0005DF0368|nr:hypothetical protein [Anaeromyxobacter sp. PSR-1]GAO01230.1 hypothetical protein PSR1_00082 [Anaeromyxobacter sp. PSR-1]